MSYAVSVITVFGTLATVLYPFLARLLFAGDPRKVGLFLGTSIHDTSQVAGAGVGCTTRFAALKGMGLKPFLVGLGAALCVGLDRFL